MDFTSEVRKIWWEDREMGKKGIFFLVNDEIDLLQYSKLQWICRPYTQNIYRRGFFMVICLFTNINIEYFFKILKLFWSVRFKNTTKSQKNVSLMNSDIINRFNHTLVCYPLRKGYSWLSIFPITVKLLEKETVMISYRFHRT